MESIFMGTFILNSLSDFVVQNRPRAEVALIPQWKYGQNNIKPDTS